MKSSVDRPTADEIAEMADSGRDISRYFTNQGTMKQPLTSISVEVTQEMLQELDHLAAALRISRQAAINACLRKALDQHLLAGRGEA
ncbi:MAG: ribbon-helix-helix protein, CopG family [Caldilineaceae bacterium]|nr:ribbon-helix-helix protein, CopG family [Caldilineaceae bacterium]MDE0338447.1 ribbon-helix-helix protein, CopG family [Caldilineaceae bacterium]